MNDIKQSASHHATVSLNAPPLDVCYHLLKHSWQSDIAYEKDGKWHIGLEALATLHLYRDSAELHSEALGTQQWQGNDWNANVQNALAALPFEHWQAFAVANFELADLFHHVSAPSPSATAPLLILIIPRYLVTLSEGHAQLEAPATTDMHHLKQVIQASDHPVTLAHTDEHWRTHIQQHIQQFDAEGYQQRVACAVDEIHQGLYRKVILSRRVPLDTGIDILASYYQGRQKNTPARSFAVHLGGQRLVGFSPETVLEVSETREISTQPLAGTRALTDDPTVNKALQEALTNDTKEIAEHAVSVKLAFEELSAICEPGSIRVTDFMHVLPRGSVQHLASRLKGRLAPPYSCWDALAMLFPAVTASGIPKQPAIDAIHRLEPCPRETYSGSVMMLNNEGALDAALVLRSLFYRGGQHYLHAGAGIVDQSHPARELEETIEKLQSVSRFLVQSQ